MPLPSGIMQPNQNGGMAAAATAAATAASGAAKGNDGSAGRKRLLCRISVWLGVGLAAYQVLWSYYLAGYNIPDVEINPLTGEKRIRRRPHKLVKFDHVQQKNVPTTPLDGIMEGHFSLMDIRVPRSGLQPSDDADKNQLYSGVQATFCHIAWRVQDADPSRVPMFKDLRDQSPLCAGTRYSVDLWEVTRQAQAFDARNHTFVATKPGPGQGPVPPTAVVFHQTRCGSTLIANVLASFMPQHTRVYSEAAAPLSALRACDSSAADSSTTTAACDRTAHVALVRDVFYMMGRTPGPVLPQYVFYKIQSIGVHAMDVFREALPDTPWIFAYRDPIEIMMSHFKNYQTGNPLGADFLPNCLRMYGKPKQPALLKEVAKAAGRSVKGLSREEYCAAHLASLGEAAIREHEKAADNVPKRWFVNYKELPFKVWEKILPTLVPFVAQEDIERMHSTGGLYSKGRGPMAGEHWREDTTMKQGTAPESVRKAAQLFMNPVYDRLEHYRKLEEGSND